MRWACIALLASCVAASALEPWQDVLLIRHGRMGAAFPTNGLVSYWSMRTNGVATVYDEFGINDATAVNTPTFIAANGVREEGAGFSSASFERISVKSSQAQLNGEDYITVSAWVKQSSAADGCVLSTVSTSPGVGLSDGISLRLRSDGKIRIVSYVSAYGARTYDSTASVFSSGSWVHFVAVFHFSAINTSIAYVNGSAVSAWSLVSQPGTEPIASSDINRIDIGATVFLSGFAEYFDGAIDEVAIWNRALTSNEVSTIYNAGAGIYYP